MEAPERLWIDIHQDLSDSFLYTFAKNDNDSDIEYVRKDAFIEKAVEHIDGLIEFLNEFGHQLKKERIIEDFKKHMEGE